MGSMTGRLGLVVLAALAALVAAVAPANAEAPYRLLTVIPVGGGGVPGDLLADTESRRLYVARSSGVAVVDLDTSRVVGEIAGAPGVRRFALAPDLGLGFTSNAREASASIVELSTLKAFSKADVGDDPDAIVYVRGIREVYVFNRRGRSATVFEARSGRVVTVLPLPGRPSSAIADAEGGRVYVEIEDRNEIAAIDVARRRVVASWPTAPCESPTGIAADFEHHHFYVGCENGLVAMMDALSGKVLSTAATGGSVGACSFDPVTGLAFASSGAGSVTLVREAARDSLAVVQKLETGSSSGAMTLDRRTHRIFLAAGDAETATSLRVLVFGREPPP
jgi:DNA-binding beta-propeller fold protein YncE